jgi:regulator of sigma E protease
VVLTILSFAFVLGILVFIHELGHFLTAKRIGVRVHEFSLGFPPKIFSRTWGETEYRIGLLPLGGYVKMAGGDVGEVTGDPRELPSRTRLERTAILLAGPLMNILLAIVLFTALFMVGVERPAGLDDPPVVSFVPSDSPAARAGVRSGDKLLEIGGRPVASWLETLEIFGLSPNQTLPLRLERGGEVVTTEIVVEARGKEESGFSGLFPEVQPAVTGFRAGYPAESSGLQKGDVIVRVDEHDISTSEQLQEAINNTAGSEFTLTILRDSLPLEFRLAATRDGDRYLIGVDLPSPVVVDREPNPLLALVAAVRECVRITGLTFTVLSRLVRGQLSLRQMMGPVGIAQASGQAARSGARSLFTLMAFFSLQLGIFNLLPIPVLDGGHIAIVALEGLARRDFSWKLKERILQVGLVLLLMLMGTVIYLDLTKIESIERFLPWR